LKLKSSIFSRVKFVPDRSGPAALQFQMERRKIVPAPTQKSVWSRNGVLHPPRIGANS